LNNNAVICHPLTDSGTAASGTYVVQIASPRNSIWHYIDSSCKSLCDVGCNVGEVLLAASQHGIAKCWGIDINPQAVAIAKDNLSQLQDSRVERATADQIPFNDTQFQAVTCLEVLEHIPSDRRKASIDEMHRVLEPSGHLIISVPHRGLFHFLDPENMRFRLPIMHNWLSKRVGGHGKEVGYDGQEHGVVWHHHFRMSELKDLLKQDFDIEHSIGRGCFLTPVGAWLRWPFYRLKLRDTWLCRMIEAMMAWEMQLPTPEWMAYNILIVARAKS
jgi:ubiquinone/menaquinone biosynthesis C-methylase UbiE